MFEQQTQLIQIVSLGQINALRELLDTPDKNLDLNQSDEDGNFAAIIAAKRNDLDMLKLLFEHGAKLDLKDGFGRDINGWAKKHQNSEMIDYINQCLSQPKNSSLHSDSRALRKFTNKIL